VVLASHGTVYGPGGQGIYQDPTYGLVIYYHYGECEVLGHIVCRRGANWCSVDTTIGYADSQKVFGWNTITWSSGWPSV